MTQSVGLISAADYSDALVALRRAKNLLVAVLLALIVGEMVIFFVARYGNLFASTGTTMATAATTLPSTQPAALSPAVLLEYLTGLIVFLGIALSVILGVVLMMTVLALLVGRLVGVAPATQAFLRCVVLAVLMFPWQAFLHFPSIDGAADFRVPGVLYTWAELVHDARFGMESGGGSLYEAILKWTRFVAGPSIAMLVLLQIHWKSRRAVRMALGETRPVSTGVGDGV